MLGLCPSPRLLVHSCNALVAHGAYRWQQTEPPKASRAPLLNRDALFSRHPSARSDLPVGCACCGWSGPAASGFKSLRWICKAMVAGPGRRLAAPAAAGPGSGLLQIADGFVWRPAAAGPGRSLRQVAPAAAGPGPGRFQITEMDLYHQWRRRRPVPVAAYAGPILR